jgi:hypothetical protein
MHKRATFFGLSSIVTLAGVIVACSSTTTVTGTDTTTPEGGAKETGTTGTKDSSTTPADDSSTTTPTGDDACGAEATLQGCGSCCVQNHQAGYKVFQDSVLACVCKGTGADGGVGPCATECAATICAATPKNPDAACNTCLQSSIGADGACTAKVSSDCQASTECLAEQKCIGTQCKGKK